MQDNIDCNVVIYTNTLSLFLAEYVKAKLKALRYSYVKAKKKHLPVEVQEKNPTKRTAWLMEKLQFLAPHVATRTSVSNLVSVSMH
jgi:hypothetical protein